MKTIKDELSSLILTWINNILLTSGKNGVKQVVSFLKEINLTPQMFKENILDLQKGSNIGTAYEKLPSALKSSLTRALNDSVKNTVSVKPKKQATMSIKKMDEEGNVIDEEDEDDDEENETQN